LQRRMTERAEKMEDDTRKEVVQQEPGILQALDDYLKITVEFPYGFLGRQAKKNARIFLRQLDRTKTGFQLEELIEGMSILYAGHVFQSDVVKKNSPLGSVGELTVLVSGSPAYLEACKAATLSTEAETLASSFERVNSMQYDIEVETPLYASRKFCERLIDQVTNFAREEGCISRISEITRWHYDDKEDVSLSVTASINGPPLSALRCQERIMALQANTTKLNQFFFYDPLAAAQNVGQKAAAQEAKTVYSDARSSRLNTLQEKKYFSK